MPTAPRVQRVPDPTSRSTNEGQGDENVREESQESLRARCQSLGEENAKLHEMLDEIAQVINGRRDKLLHDVRNVMNELVLLRRLVDDDQ